MHGGSDRAPRDTVPACGTDSDTTYALRSADADSPAEIMNGNAGVDACGRHPETSCRRSALATLRCSGDHPIGSSAITMGDTCRR